jgi:Flp pilus assembly protein TadG
VLRRLPWDNRGAIAIISGLVLVPVLLFTALVVDVGRMYYVRRDLQNIADAACLACAYGYGLSGDATNAQTEANEALANNGFVVGGGNTATVTVPVPAGDPDYKAANPRVKVTLVQNTGLFFARIINHFSKDIGATGACELGSMTASSHVLPFGIPTLNGEIACPPNPDPLFGYPLGKVIRFKVESMWAPGNFGPMDFSGGGASTYQDTIVNGTTSPVYQCYDYNSETGGMSGPTEKGLDDRIPPGSDDRGLNLSDIHACPPGSTEACTPSLYLGSWIASGCPDTSLPPGPDLGPAGDCTSSPWNTYASFPLAVAINKVHGDTSATKSIWDCSRVGVVPFITPFPNGQSEPVTILGFGVFFITNWGKTTGKVWIEGAFIRAAADPYAWTQWGPWQGVGTPQMTVALVK